MSEKYFLFFKNIFLLEFNFDVKSREYESKLKILRNDLNRTEDELNHSQNLSQRVKDECDTTKNKVCKKDEI